MIDRNAIKRQQLVLKHLGYYLGEIDGIWSTKSIEAKVAFERSGKFNPGIPSSGMPFRFNVRLPEGLYFDAKGYVAVVGFDVDTLKVEKQQVVEKSQQPVAQQPAQVQQPIVSPVDQKVEKEVEKSDAKDVKHQNNQNNQKK